MCRNYIKRPILLIIFTLISGLILSQFLNSGTLHKYKENNEDVNLNTSFYQPALTLKSVPISGNLSQMKYFFDALKQAANSQVRVAHYGDSGILGDMITYTIREDLQKLFGGSTVGFLSITSQDIYCRGTTNQSFSDNWKTVNLLTSNPQNLPLGISGYVSIPKGQSWVRYATTDWHSYLKNFTTAKLFYSNAKNSSIKYSFNDLSNQYANLEPGSDIKELVLKAPGSYASSIKLTATQPDQAYFYGVSLESGNGVYIDNYPWPANTGLGFKSIPQSSLIQFNKLMNYKLIILSFGAFETIYSSDNDKWYEKQMINVINNLKIAFPETGILLIVVGDMGTKKGTKFITNPRIPELNKLQLDIVDKTGIAAWNLFQAMGGSNSMDRWVHANPPLAAFDYEHPTDLGAEKIGHMMAKALIDAYSSYK
jgi:hypothetical protein